MHNQSSPHPLKPQYYFQNISKLSRDFHSSARWTSTAVPPSPLSQTLRGLRRAALRVTHPPRKPVVGVAGEVFSGSGYIFCFSFENHGDSSSQAREEGGECVERRVFNHSLGTGSAPPLMDQLIPATGPPTAAPVRSGAARGGSQPRRGSQANNTTTIQQTGPRGGGTNPGTARRPLGPGRGGSCTRSRGGVLSRGQGGSRGGVATPQGNPNRKSIPVKCRNWCRDGSFPKRGGGGGEGEGEGTW
jgi:hypothetical protein